jgi:hypothetical protein
MASNKIQIKRSTANAVVTGLSNGELAFTQAGNILYVGAPDGTSGSLRIGGLQTPGTLTANQALVANSTSGIDKVITSNAVLTSIWANGAAGTNGQVLVTNGTAVYWGTGTSGANTQIQFNDSGVANATAGFTFTKTTNTLFVGNTVTIGSVNAYINSISFGYVGNTTTSPTVTLSNTGVIQSGNTSVTAAPQLVIANSVGSTVVNTNVISTTTVLANVSGSYVNVSGQVNTATLYATTSANIASAVQANSTGVFTTGTVNGAVLSVGTNFIANSLGAYSTGTVNAAAVTVGTNFIANSLGAYSTGVVNGASHTIGTNFIANTTKITFTGANIDATSAALAINAATITSQLTVNGNTVLGDASSDTINPFGYFSNNVIPSANVTYTLGTTANRWNTVFANTVNAVSGNFSGSLSVGGDLTITGNLVTSNVTSVLISDPLIYLAANNTLSDLLDIGFVGDYGDGVTNRHTGFFRDHVDGIYKLFSNTTQQLTGNNDVDTSDASYRIATLQAYLISGGLTTNSTSANLIANSTYNVGIVANTLTLSTALAGTSGGTGKATVANNSLLFGNSTNGYNELTFNSTAGYVLQSNGTAIVYDVLDGGTF